MEDKQFQKILHRVSELNSNQRLKMVNAIKQSGDFKQLVDFFESLFAHLAKCPHCDSKHIIRYGSKSGLNRFKCHSCNKTFNCLTGTPFARLRKKELWIQYLQSMIDTYSVRKAAEKLKINKNTAFKWRHRFLSFSHQDKPQLISGIVEADETYFRKSKKGCRHLKRAPRKRGESATTRGLSKEHVCVVVTCDRAGHEADYISGLGPVKGKWLDLVLSGHISRDSLLVTGAQPSYDVFCAHQNISHARVRSDQKVIGPYHIQNVNAYHSCLKRWMKNFNGVATKYLNHYLGWCHGLHNRHVKDPLSLLKALLLLKQYLTKT